MEKQIVTVEILENYLKTEQRIFRLMKSYVTKDLTIDEYESKVMNILKNDAHYFSEEDRSKHITDIKNDFALTRKNLEDSSECRITTSQRSFIWGFEVCSIEYLEQECGYSLTEEAKEKFGFLNSIFLR